MCNSKDMKKSYAAQQPSQSPNDGSGIFEGATAPQPSQPQPSQTSSSNTTSQGGESSKK